MGEGEKSTRSDKSDLREILWQFERFKAEIGEEVVIVGRYVTCGMI